MSAFIQTLISIANAEVGVTEKPLGTNRGPRVDEYQRRTGYQPGVFWCLCYLYWCLDETCQKLDIDNPFIRTGGCDQFVAWARGKNILKTSPESGDFGFVIQNGNDATHVFLVVSVAGSTMTTLEGNSNMGGSSNGIAVVRRTRQMKSSYVYARVNDVVPGVQLPGRTMRLVGPNSFALDMEVVRGKSLAPIRKVVKELGFKDGQVVTDQDITFNKDENAVSVKGSVIPAEVTLKSGAAHCHVVKLLTFLGWTFTVDVPNATVTAH